MSSLWTTGDMIRGLSKIDNEATFDQLIQILRRENYGNTFRVAVYALGKLKNYDPSPVLLEVLKRAPDHACESLIVPIAERGYIPAIPVLEEKIAKASNYADGVHCQIWAAGALCKFNKDYEKNAAIVREYLKKDYDPNHAGYAPYGVARWLNDKETVNILISKLCSKELNKETVKWTINALGQIGDKSALPALRKALSKVPLMIFGDIGEAIATIGRKNQDQAIVSEGEIVQTVARYLTNLGPQQRASPAVWPEMKQSQREYAQVVEWLKLHREAIPNIIEQSCSEWNREQIAQLMKIAQLEMVADLAKEEFKPGECIEVRLNFKNLASESLYFQREGIIRAVFIINGQEKSFLQAAPSRYKLSGVYRSLILPLNPGETWTTNFEVFPKTEELIPGEYPMKVYYTVTEHYTLPECGHFEGALVGTLASNELTVKIK